MHQWVIPPNTKVLWASPGYKLGSHLRAWQSGLEDIHRNRPIVGLRRMQANSPKPERMLLPYVGSSPGCKVELPVIWICVRSFPLVADNSSLRISMHTGHVDLFTVSFGLGYDFIVFTNHWEFEHTLITKSFPFLQHSFLGFGVRFNLSSPDMGEKPLHWRACLPNLESESWFDENCLL